MDDNNIVKKSVLLLFLSSVAVFAITTITTTTTLFVSVADAAVEEQIIINPNNIKNLNAFGEYNNPDYTNFYIPSFLFDNLENSYSFWSQLGKSGFNLELNEPLQKQVCAIEIGVKDPKQTPFKLIINDNNIFNGTLNDVKVPFNFISNDGTCISQVNKISMEFSPKESNIWTTLSEIRLFSEEIKPPPIEPPGGNVTKIIINNSKVEMDLQDSEVTIKLGDNAKLNTITNSNTAAAAEPTPTTTPTPEPTEEQEEEEEDEDEEEDDKK